MVTDDTPVLVHNCPPGEGAEEAPGPTDFTRLPGTWPEKNPDTKVEEKGAKPGDATAEKFKDEPDDSGKRVDGADSLIGTVLKDTGSSLPEGKEHASVGGILELAISVVAFASKFKRG